MSLHGTPSHVELAGDLGIVASLQKQFDNLLFARPQPNSLILHQLPLFVVLCFPWPGEQHGSFPILIASSLPFSMVIVFKADGGISSFLLAAKISTSQLQVNSPGSEKVMPG